MANPDHLALLRMSVRAWNQWRHEYGNVKPDLSRANLLDIDLSYKDLSGADLSGTTLSGMKIYEVNLTGADLRSARLDETVFEGFYPPVGNPKPIGGAELCGANLAYAIMYRSYLFQGDLRGANLRGADLRRSNLTSADLSQADLTYAHLEEALLDNTVLMEANLNYARFGWTVMANVNLGASFGLETVEHVGPSTLGIDTLLKSGRRLSVDFLRGCGVQEALIEYLPSLHAARAIEHFSCFISYSHADVIFARRLHDYLLSKGIRCWRDEKDVRPGDRILDAVDAAIRLHDKLILCCSQASLQSWWVKDEVRKAQERERREARLLIIPLNLDGYIFEWQDGLASDLTTRLVADFSGWEREEANFESSCERLLDALRSVDQTAPRDG